MIVSVQTVNAEKLIRKSNNNKNKIKYKNIIKYKNKTSKPWKCISTNIEECASKCTDQDTKHIIQITEKPKTHTCNRLAQNCYINEIKIVLTSYVNRLHM